MTHPTSGNDGKIVTGRQIRERLEKEAYTMYQLSWKSQKLRCTRVFGRGELQLAILIEQMRREGFEMCISKTRSKTS